VPGWLVEAYSGTGFVHTYFYYIPFPLSLSRGIFHKSSHLLEHSQKYVWFKTKTVEPSPPPPPPPHVQCASMTNSGSVNVSTIHCVHCSYANIGLHAQICIWTLCVVSERIFSASVCRRYCIQRFCGC